MLAALHRKLVSAPFLGLLPHPHAARRFEKAGDGNTLIQKNLRENAALILTGADRKLPQRHHMDDRGGSVLYTDERTKVASNNEVNLSKIERLMRTGGMPQAQSYRNPTVCVCESMLRAPAGESRLVRNSHKLRGLVRAVLRL